MNTKGVLYINSDYYALEDKILSKSPIAYRMFKYFIGNMDKNNKVDLHACSYKAMQKFLGVSKPTVATAIKVLKQYNVVFVDKVGNNNFYTINQDIAVINFKAKYPIKQPQESI
jgi:predicted transcriptional regulator